MPIPDDPWRDDKLTLGDNSPLSALGQNNTPDDPWANDSLSLDGYEPQNEASVGNPLTNLTKGIGKGVIYGIPGQLAKSAQFLGIGGDTAKQISEWSDKNLKGTPGIMEQAGQMIPQSVGIPLASITAGKAISMIPHPAAKAVGVGLQLLGKYVTPALFGLSQAQTTRDAAREAGVDEGIIPYITGGVEWAGETLANMALGRLLGPLGNISAEAMAKGSVTSALKGTIGGYVKEMALRTLPTEISTEMGQNFFEALAEQKSGIRPDAQPMQEAVSAIGPTAVMSLLLGGAGGVARSYIANKQSAILSQPADENSPEFDNQVKVRSDVARLMSDTIQDESLRNQWLDYASQKIDRNLPIDINAPLDSLSMEIDSLMDEMPEESNAVKNVSAPAPVENAPEENLAPAKIEPQITEQPKNIVKTQEETPVIEPSTELAPTPTIPQPEIVEPGANGEVGGAKADEQGVKNVPVTPEDQKAESIFNSIMEEGSPNTGDDKLDAIILDELGKSDVIDPEMIKGIINDYEMGEYKEKIEPATPDYQAEADKIGITFNGMQDIPNKPSIPTFTDPETKGTFMVKEGETVQGKLDELREKFKNVPGEWGETEKVAEVDQVAKEPWQMTQAEYIPGARARMDKENGWRTEYKKNLTPAAKSEHRVAVEQAIKEGKPVPASVLADYPDLIPTKVAPGIQATKEKIAKVKKENTNDTLPGNKVEAASAGEKTVAIPVNKDTAISNPKTIKESVLSQLEPLITEARNKWREEIGGAGNKLSDEELDKRVLSGKFGDNQPGEKIVINYPGGQYTPNNTLKSLLFLRGKVKSLPVNPPSTSISKPSTKPTGKSPEEIFNESKQEVDEYEFRREGAKNDYEFLVNEALPRARERETEIDSLREEVLSGTRTLKSLADYVSPDGVKLFSGRIPSSDSLRDMFQEARARVDKLERDSADKKTYIIEAYPKMAKEMWPDENIKILEIGRAGEAPIEVGVSVPDGKVGTFSDRIRTYSKESPAEFITKYENQLADSDSQSIIIPNGERIAFENVMFAESTNNTGLVGDDISISGDVGSSIFRVSRPYGTLTYNEATGELTASPAPITSMMVAENVKFGVDKTLLLQTLSKDIVNNDLAGTIANETIQNALDAFSPNQKDARIDIKIYTQYNNHTDGITETVVEVTDNGRGMSKNDVKNKLMKLGAQGKSGTDTRGGYGLAKAAFMLAPRRTEVVTRKNGVEVKLTGTREQFFGVPGEDDPMLEIEDVSSDLHGTTFRMYFFFDQEDADKENSYSLSSWSANSAFDRFISDGVKVDNITITKQEGQYEDPQVHAMQSPSSLPQIFKKEKLSVLGNDLTLYFVEDKSPRPMGWDDKYHINVSTTNKGLALFGIRPDSYNFQGLWEPANWKLIINFDNTPDVRDINYPFIRNRTEMNREVAMAVDNIVSAKIKKINEDKFTVAKDDFNQMVKDSPLVEGIRIMIPFKDKNEFTRAKSLIIKNNAMVSDLAKVFSSFRSILSKIGEKDIELAMTVDPKVHGFRPNKEAVGHEFYAINPFAITHDFQLNPAFMEIMKTGYDRNSAMASNLIHTLVHEFTHNFAGNHNESFTSALANLYMKITHTQLARLEQQARSFYEKHGELLESIQTDFARMGEGGSRFQQNNLNVQSSREDAAGIENGRNVQGVGPERIISARIVDNPIISKAITLTDQFQSAPQFTVPDSWVKESLQPFLKTDNDFRFKDKYLGLPWWNAKRYPAWRRAFEIFGIERPEDRGRLMHTFAQVAEPFFTMEQKMRKAGRSAQDIVNSKDRISRVIITGDAQLGPYLKSLRSQYRELKDGPEKTIIAEKIAQIERDNRYSDEQLLAGIKDDRGNTVKLTQQEIDAYKSVRASLDKMFDSYEKHLQAQTLRAYKNQKWYTVLSQALGMDLNDDLVAMTIGKKLNKAALLKAKSIQPNIKNIFARAEKLITETPDAEKLKAGELYGKLADKMTQEITDLRDAIKEISGVTDDKELTQMAKDVFSAYLMVRPQAKKIKALRNLYKKQVAFFPRVREQGKYKLKLIEDTYDDEGNLIDQKQLYMKMFNTEKGGKDLYADVMARFGKNGKLPPNTRITTEAAIQTPEFAFQGVNDINMQKVLDDAIEGLKIRETYYNDQGTPVNLQDHLRNLGFEAIAKQFQSRGFGRHMTHRQFNVVKGYEETGLEKILFNYMSGMSGIMTKQIAAADFLEHMKSVKDPKMFEALNKYGRDQLRNETGMDKVSNKVRSFMFTWYLGGVLRPAIIQLTQNFVTGIPKHAQWLRENNLGGAGKADKDYLTAMKDMTTKNLTETEAKMEAQLFTDGVTVDQYIREIYGSVGSRWNQGFEKWMGYLAIPFSRMEIFNRQSAALTRFRPAYKIAMEKVGKRINGREFTEEDAYNEAFDSARSFVYDTHYAMGKANLPQMAQGEGTGVAIKTLYTFKSFTHNFALSTYNDLSLGDWKTVLHSMAYLAMFGGLMGLPFFKDLFEFIEKYFGYSPATAVRQSLRGMGGKTLEQFGMNGLPAMLGMNMSGSLAMGVPFMGEDTLSTIGGVYEGQLQKFTRAFDAFSRSDYYRAAANLAPEFARGPITAAYESQVGKEVFGTPGSATTTRGGLVFDKNGNPLSMTGYEAALKSIGFTPENYSREREMDATIKRQKAWVDGRKADIAETYRVERLNRNPNATKNMIKAVRELNSDIKDRDLESLVPRATVGKIIQSSRQIKNMQERRQERYKRAEL